MFESGSFELHIRIIKILSIAHFIVSFLFPLHLCRISAFAESDKSTIYKRITSANRDVSNLCHPETDGIVGALPFII